MVLPGVISALFSTETNPIRFESFCIDLCRKVYGFDFVPTSRTWDLGRDGRALRRSPGSRPAILCASIEADIDAKVKADMKRLAQTTESAGVIYCSSQALTELRCDKTGAIIRELYPQAELVEVLGQAQLLDLAQRNEEILRHHYGAEIDNAEKALRVQPGAPRVADDIGLRLALITQTGEDAQQLREDVARRLILDTLLEGNPLSPSEITQLITAKLHLPRSVSAWYVEGLLEKLRETGLVSLADGKAVLTAAGVEDAQAVTGDATQKLLQGRAAVREAIRSLTGYTLMDQEFDRVWNTLQDGLADLFYKHGMAMVRMVRSLLEEEAPISTKEPARQLDDLADRVAALFGEPTRGSDVRQAILDMFSERSSPAFEWLTEICSVYVMMCSLGFEALSAQQTTAALSAVGLVPDTDVVISFLCEGEENHPEVNRILTAWRAVGGRVLMTRAVLEEVSYHAWISENDFLAIEHDLAALSDTDALRLVENAFVRAFRKVGKDKLARKYWHSYIQQYRGDNEWDYGPLAELLRDEYGFDSLPDAEADYEAFVRSVKSFLLGRVAASFGCQPEDLDHRAKDKCRRDSLLLASVLAGRSRARSAGTRGSFCIITSAHLLEEAGLVFEKDLGKPEAVLSTASVGLLLTLIPQVSMGVAALRSILFDDLLVARLAPAQRFAYRLIAASERYDVPWSRRGTLLKELGNVLFSEARAQRKPVREIRESILRSPDPEHSAWIVARALDAMPGVDKRQAENYQLQAEVKRLAEELEQTRAALTEARSKRAPAARPSGPRRKRRR